jgi:hypothetical protein
MGGLMSAARLDATQRSKEFLGRNRSHRAIADVRVQKALQSRAENRHGLGREGLALKVEPLRSDGFERFGARAPLCFTPGARVDAVRDELARFSRARLSVTSG